MRYLRFLLLVGGTALASGCQGEVTTQPTSPPPPPPVAVAPAPPPPPSVEANAPGAEANIVYEIDPPVPDVESLPSVTYAGAPAYFVGGAWYRRGPSGWGRFVVEPPELARARIEHAQDPRWESARSRFVLPRPPVGHPAPPSGIAEPQRSSAPPTPPPPDSPK
jgi:hypothetical protein